jgi:hypothetical protein
MHRHLPRPARPPGVGGGVNCTGGCEKRAPVGGPGWAEDDTRTLRKLGWFFYASGTEARFLGIVLCPECRAKPTAVDGYGRVYETAELERLASLPRRALGVA